MKKRILRALAPLLLALLLFSALSLPVAAETPLRSVAAGDALSAAPAEALYEELSAWLARVSRGETLSTELSLDLEDYRALGMKTEWTREDGLLPFTTEAANTAFWEQLDLSRVLDLLEHNHPYELYWYDKTESGGTSYGCTFSTNSSTSPTSIRVTSARLALRVSADYQAENYEKNAPTLNPSRVARAEAARAAADAIVAAHAQKSPAEKLDAFREEILSRVEYDTAAAAGGVPYGDPWQMISVFDGDAETNVVCEGYSKAFQYLCDAAGLTAYTVTGLMGEENHMWNVVTMQDGRNYLADLTNSDEGTIGSSGELFLSGAVGTPHTGYTLTAGGTEIPYVYSDATLLLHTPEVLTLSEEPYTGVFGVAFTFTGGEMRETYDGTPLKAFSLTQTVSGDPDWLAYTKGALVYLGDGTVDEETELIPVWHALRADGTRAEALSGEPTDAGDYVLTVTRTTDGKEFVSPTVRIDPLPVRIEGILAADRTYDGTAAVSVTSVTLAAAHPLPAHLAVDLTVLRASLPSPDAGDYGEVLLTGELRFTTEERNYRLENVHAVPLSAPLTVSKAPAPTLPSLTPVLTAPQFILDAAGWLEDTLPADAGDLLISVTDAKKWGELQVSDWSMDRNGVISAALSGLRGGDRLEITLTVETENYEAVTVLLVATAPCPLKEHVFSSYTSDRNATCTADGTQTAVCDGCDLTHTRPDEGSRTPHRYADGACTACGAAAPTPPATEEAESTLSSTPPATEEAESALSPTTPSDGTEKAPSDTEGFSYGTQNTGAQPWFPIAAAVCGAAFLIILLSALLLKRRR